MTVKILKAADPVEVSTITILVYGDPGAGKTSLASTADSPLLLDFDRGAYRSEYRCDSVQIASWDDVAGLDDAALSPYQTIVVDTAGRCLDSLAADIMREEPKHKTRHGQLTLQGYGALKGRFAAWMESLRSTGKDVVLIAHGKEERKGDDLIIRPDMTGGSYGEVFKLADAVGYLLMRGQARTLRFDPQESAVGKNPARLPEIEVPDLSTQPQFLADLMVQIKGAMGQISTQGKEIAEVVAKWSKLVAKASDAAAVNTLITSVATTNGSLPESARKQTKAMIVARAKDLGLAWNAKAKAYEAADSEAA